MEGLADKRKECAYPTLCGIGFTSWIHLNGLKVSWRTKVDGQREASQTGRTVGHLLIDAHSDSSLEQQQTHSIFMTAWPYTGQRCFGDHYELFRSTERLPRRMRPATFFLIGVDILVKLADP